MKSIWVYIISIYLCSAFSIDLNAQSKDLPGVFLIGENEETYEKMIREYEDLLLTVSNNSMDLAYDRWLDMLVKMEVFADSIAYDIKGVKIWINVFWNKDGTIDHIAYYPKPNSRNMDFDKLTEFFLEFISEYRMDIEAKRKFSHYGSASFPTFAKSRAIREK